MGGPTRITVHWWQAHLGKRLFSSSFRYFDLLTRYSSSSPFRKRSSRVAFFQPFWDFLIENERFQIERIRHYQRTNIGTLFWKFPIGSRQVRGIFRLVAKHLSLATRDSNLCSRLEKVVRRREFQFRMENFQNSSTTILRGSNSSDLWFFENGRTFFRKTSRTGPLVFTLFRKMLSSSELRFRSCIVRETLVRFSRRKKISKPFFFFLFLLFSSLRLQNVYQIGIYLP